MVNPLRYFVRALELAWEYAGDAWAFAIHNGYSPFEPVAVRKFFNIVISAHAVEKGLTLPKPRLLFGGEKIKQLRNAMADYDNRTSFFPIEMAEGVLADYANFNISQGVDRADLAAVVGEVEERIDQKLPLTGGVRTVDAPSLCFTGSAETFLRSRTSCRTFSATTLSLTDVRLAVELAQSAPSQCNRQSCKVHFFQGQSAIQQLLLMQGGASGFAEDISNLFIVTSQITAWGGPNQRNQPFVDGGIFSMSLILALLSQGISSCPLNLAVTNALERRIKAVAQIPSNERLVVMLAAGYTLEPEIRVAKSPRRPVDEVLQVHSTN